MKKIFKKIAAAVTTLSIIAAAVVFDVPVKFTAEAAASSAGGCDGTHDDMIYWANSTSLPKTSLDTRNKIYLETDVTLTTEYLVTKDLTICLNGHTISAPDANRIFFVKEGCTLTICDCKGTGKLIGGDVSGNGTDNDSGGAICVKGTFIMNGGIISENKANYGGGVLVSSNGTFTMTGGTITENNADSGGSVFVNSNGTFNMSGGTISGNAATRYGGGVYASGAINMSGGTISGNTATQYGGGVYANSTFEMNGGTISNNKETQYGSGVYVASSGEFKMIDGTISGNTATYNGGGVYVGGTFKINGTADISGNKKTDNSANNVTLGRDKTITVESGFNTASSIGVNTITAPTCTAPVDVTGATAQDISGCFTSDKSGQNIVYKDNKIKLAVAHTATKTEAKDATCTEDGNVEYWHCSKCDKNFSDSECTTELTTTVITKTGHTTEKIEAVAAACTKTGLTEGEKCSVCGKITKAQTTVPALSHDFGEWAVAQAATCTTAGINERNCKRAGCGEKETNPIPASGHTYTDGKCTVCGAIDIAHDHIGGTATCSKKAVCEICGQEYGELAAHSYGAWSVTKNPSETAAGTAERICSCGKKDIKTDVPALNDTSVWTKVDDAHVDPTTTTPGKDVYTSETYGTIEVILPATGSGNSGNSGNSGSSSSGSSSRSSSSSKKPPVAEVELDGDVPDTEIATPDKELKDTILSEAELAAAEGDDISFILQIKDIDPGADKQTIESRLGSTDGFKVGQYIDVSLFKVVNGSETKLTNTNKPIKVRFEIPEELRADGRTFAVIRVHDGKTAILADLDNDSGTITIETDKFSTYALIYSDSPTAKSNPYTGTATAVFPITLIAAAVMLLSKRRRQ